MTARCTRCKKTVEEVGETGLCPACEKAITDRLNSPNAPWNSKEQRS